MVAKMEAYEKTLTKACEDHQIPGAILVATSSDGML